MQLLSSSLLLSIKIQFVTILVNFFNKFNYFSNRYPTVYRISIKEIIRRGAPRLISLGHLPCKNKLLDLPANILENGSEPPAGRNCCTRREPPGRYRYARRRSFRRVSLWGRRYPTRPTTQCASVCSTMRERLVRRK